MQIIIQSVSRQIKIIVFPNYIKIKFKIQTASHLIEMKSAQNTNRNSKVGEQIDAANTNSKFLHKS